MAFKNIIFYLIGSIALILAIIGIFLPVLPTTPFAIVAVACFARCNERLANKIRSTKYIGEYLDNYENKTGVSFSTKRKTLIFLWFGLMLSMFLINQLTITIILCLVGLGVTLHIVLLKTTQV